MEDEDLHLEWSDPGRDTVYVYQEMKIQGESEYRFFYRILIYADYKSFYYSLKKQFKTK